MLADGGSRDGSVERALRRDDLVACVTRPGRGHQLRAGAALATGELLAFVHVDVRLPDGALDDVRRVLSDGRHEAGAFVTRTRPDPSLPNPLGPLLRLADLRSRWTRHPYGDQAPFVTRAAYEAVGGFPDQPLMEDYELSLRLAARRPIARVRREVLVSGRRFQRRPLRSALLMRVLPPLYRLGVPPERLARLYRGR
ncbi:MAG: glycosyltransferase family 2 protein [Planctomycetes bacterium]|nr:glycosyltransferase family 2 protein [Planctomycetota bacterium]